MKPPPDFVGLSVGEVQRVCVSRLKDAGVDDSVLEARLLLGFVLGGGPERVLADRDELLADEQAARLSVMLEQRSRRMPISQILGVREFWSLPFKVTPATLSPRPDSETIVEAALEHAIRPPRSVLDLGTGTGCLLLALLSEWKEAQGVGVDASADALSVAMDNARALEMIDRVKLVQADWNQPEWRDDLGGPFDVVVSNPPYIPTDDVAGLDADVRNFEPHTALDGGPSGLDAYRVLSAALPQLLKADGTAVFEVGIDQADDVAVLLADVGLSVMDKCADLGGVVRAVVARKP